jgi:hypothetical protein
MDPTTMRVDELREGDMVDLEGDPFADPDRSEDWLHYEFAVVADTERETDECVRVDCLGVCFGAPPDHRVLVIDRDR